jgi:MoxR-vWA-beta-propeller ternary system protein
VNGEGALSAVRVEVGWRARRRPLEPCAALAIGNATCVRLATRLLELSDAELDRLSGCFSERCLLVLGNADDLPWVDALSYLGKDAAGPRLLLPTALEPSVPVALLERAVLAHAARIKPDAPAQGTWALNPSPALLLPAVSARRLERSRLEAHRGALLTGREAR